METQKRMAPRNLGTLGLLAFSGSVLLLQHSGCTDAHVDLQHQIAVLQSELERVRAENASARIRTAAPESQVSAAATTLDNAKIEQGFEEAAYKLRATLLENLPDSRVENLTRSAIENDVLDYPIRSNLAIRVRIGEQTYTLQGIPVKANIKGRWILPGAAEIAENFKKLSASQASPTPARPQERVETPSNANGRKASSTVLIQWAGSSATNPGSRSGNGAEPSAEDRRSAAGAPVNAPRDAAPPPGGGNPRPRNSPVMPVQKDIEIKFQ